MLTEPSGALKLRNYFILFDILIADIYIYTEIDPNVIIILKYSSNQIVVFV